MIIINPGSGPVANATRENAEANMTRFATDLIEGGYAKSVVAVPDQPEAPENRGRFTFNIVADGETHEIEMPGLPIEQVRYVDSETQNIWDFPRLYVDGSSWVWMFALSATMNDPEDEDEAAVMSGRNLDDVAPDRRGVLFQGRTSDPRTLEAVITHAMALTAAKWPDESDAEAIIAEAVEWITANYVEMRTGRWQDDRTRDLRQAGR